MDLGSGTGYANSWLSERAEQLVNVDLAEGMLSFAQSQGCKGSHVAGDAESLPIAGNTLDLLWSSLALQWSEQPEGTFIGYGQRILATDADEYPLLDIRELKINAATGP